MPKSKKAFTLIELLVAIAIIGFLATISIIALSNARAKSRDAKRAGDMKQVQTALELFFNDNNRYPTAEEFALGSIFSTSSGATSTYMKIIPAAPTPVDGSCNSSQNNFYYTQTENGNSYTISFCLGNTTGTLAAGPKCLTPAGIVSSDCSSSSHASGFQATIIDYLSSVVSPAGTATYGSGSYSADGNQHAIQVYAYQDVAGQYFVSDPATIDLTDDASNSDYHIDWSWSAVPEADGYVVIKESNVASKILENCQTIEAMMQRVSELNQVTNQMLVQVGSGIFTVNDIHSIAQELGYMDDEKTQLLNEALTLIYNLPDSLGPDINSLISAEAAIRVQLDNMAGCTTTTSGEAYAAAARALLLDFIDDVNSVRMTMGDLQAGAEIEVNQGYYQTVTGTAISDTSSSVWQVGDPSRSNFFFTATGMNHLINIYYYKNNGETKLFSDYYSEASLTDDSSGRYYDISLGWDLGDNDGVRLLWSPDGNIWYYQDIEGASSIRFSQLTSLQEGSNPPTN